MLEDLYENNSYEVLKRTAEDRSAWRESTRKKVSKTCSGQNKTVTLQWTIEEVLLRTSGDGCLFMLLIIIIILLLLFFKSS